MARWLKRGLDASAIKAADANVHDPGSRATFCGVMPAKADIQLPQDSN